MPDMTGLIESLDERTITKRAADRECGDAMCAYFGQPEAAELKELASSALEDGAAKGEKVLILPGFLGSKLSVRSRWHFDGSDLIWIDPVDIFLGGLGKLAWDPDDDRVEATGALHIAYLKMLLTLRVRGFDAHYLPFDWRKSPQANASVILPMLRDQAPVTLVAHSQGGRVARALAGLDPNGQVIRRVITIATPHFGLYSPVRAVAVQFKLLETVEKLDPSRSERDIARQILRNLPGLLDLLPVQAKRPDERYFERDWWPDGVELPDVRPLAAARATSAGLAPLDQRAAMIIGVGNTNTTVSAARRGRAFVYGTGRGDGTVPLDLAEVEGIPTWYTTAGHAFMARNRAVIDAVTDLIEGSSTRALEDSVNGALGVPAPDDGAPGDDSMTKSILRALED